MEWRGEEGHRFKFNKVINYRKLNVLIESYREDFLYFLLSNMSASGWVVMLFNEA